MLKFLKPAPDAVEKVPADQVPGKMKLWQLRVLISTSVMYIGYYLIRDIFKVQQTQLHNDYGFSLTQIGGILSMFGIGYGISKLIMGTLADRSNANRYVATGLIVSAIINVFLGSTREYTVLLVLMLINSVMQGMGAAGCQRSVSLWFARKGKGSLIPRGTAYSIWSSAHNAGGFLCVAIIQLAAYIFGGELKYSFYAASALSLIIAVICLWLGADRPTSKGLPTIEEYSGDKVMIKEGVVVEGDVTTDSVFAVFVKYILKNPLVLAVIFTSLSLYVVRFGVGSWIPSYLSTEKGFSAAEAKWLVGIFELAAIPGVILLGLISDLLKGRRGLVLVWALLAMVACLFTYFISNNHTVIVISLVLLGNLIYAPVTIVGLMVNEAVPKFAVGMSTGAMGFAQYVIGEVIATLGVGHIAESYGWGASNAVLYGFTGLAILLSIYIMIHQNRMFKEIDGQ